MKQIIGLVGFKGSGKDTAAMVLSHHGYRKEAFAAPLKDVISDIFSWDRKMLEGETKESREWRECPDPYWSKAFGYDVVPRVVLQKFGTESMRDVFHDDIWVRSLLRRIELSEDTRFVISDVRFQNEVEAIQEMGGIIVRIRRGPEPLWFLLADQANRGQQDAMLTMIETGVHRSEWDWIGCQFDMVIDNNSTIKNFAEQVDKIVDKYRMLC